MPHSIINFIFLQNTDDILVRQCSLSLLADVPLIRCSFHLSNGNQSVERDLIYRLKNDFYRSIRFDIMNERVMLSAGIMTSYMDGNYDLRGFASSAHQEIPPRDSYGISCVQIVIIACILQSDLSEGKSLMNINTFRWLIASTPSNIVSSNVSSTWITYGNKANILDQKEIQGFDSDKMLQVTSSLTASNVASVTDEQLSDLRMHLKSLGISTDLRKYQLEGIIWLTQQLTKEFQTPFASSFDGWLPCRCLNENMAMGNAMSKDIYYHILTGQFSMDRSVQSEYDILPERVLGAAILADSMGLGKSLQVIALALNLGRTWTCTITSDVPPMHSSCNSLNHERVCICGRRDNIKATRKLQQGKRKRSDCDEEVSETDLWIMCDSCKYWYHTVCAGVSSDQLNDQSFVCISCECVAYSKHPLPSKVTVVVMPDNLVHQWRHEILKHTSFPIHLDSELEGYEVKPASDVLKCAVYEGCDIDKFTGSGNSLGLHHISPTALGQHDFILVGLSALRKDFNLSNYSNENDVKRRSMGNVRKRSSSASNQGYYARRYFPPPLLCLKYLMIVVDETQRLESNGVNQYLHLVSRLQGQYRLCVSGTPIGMLLRTLITLRLIFMMRCLCSSCKIIRSQESFLLLENKSLRRQQFDVPSTMGRSIRQGNISH